MIKELILIRHGESRHLVEDLTGGWTDTHLTDRGIAQAKAVSERLQKLLNGLEYTFFSSDLVRASETSEIISRYINKEPIYLKNLRELNNGIAVGLSNEDARKLMNPLIDSREDWIPFKNGESWRMLYHRATIVLKEISSIEKNRAVIVSHGNTLRCIISSWLGISLEGKMEFRTNSTRVILLGYG